MTRSVTVAIPTRNAGSSFGDTLAAVRSQRLDRPLQVLICDSGSSDATVAAARAHGAEVIVIAPEAFSHGGTRNLLMSRADGDHVAFLTQDAVPADEYWLSRLLDAFDLRPAVGLAFGPYLPRHDASLQVARELSGWFGSLSSDEPRVDSLESSRRAMPSRDFLGGLGYFTDANGCIARTAWQEVPFRAVPYAEDHLLAQDMLRAGFAKVFVPRAAVVHSHEYSPGGWLRRSFDEARAIQEIYGWTPGLREAITTLWGNTGADWRWARRESGGTRLGVLPQSFVHHGARTVGTILGGRADQLPTEVRCRLSLEGRS